MKSTSFRVACSGGCGRQVLRKLGECRKCRRARLHEGAKHLPKAKVAITTGKAWTRKKPRRESIFDNSPLKSIWGKP